MFVRINSRRSAERMQATHASSSPPESYLTFQDIAPQARLERHRSPPLRAVLGSALALVGELLFR